MFSKALVHLRRQWMGALALFLVLTGGTAYAAGALDGPLPGTNQVGSLDIINGQVLSADVGNGQVKTADLGAGAVTEAKLAPAAQLTTASLLSCGGGNNWGSLDHPVAYLRDRDGIVHLQGDAGCNDGFTNSTQPIFALPNGFRPASGAALAVVVRAEAAGGGAFPDTLFVGGTTGAVTPEAAASRISLDGVSFRCAPSGQDGCP
jgi:hypothetical protein